MIKMGEYRSHKIKKKNINLFSPNFHNLFLFQFECFHVVTYIEMLLLHYKGIYILKSIKSSFGN